MDDKKLASAALQFLGRVTLSGQEVPAFNAVTAWLGSVALKADEAPEVCEDPKE